MRTKQVRPEKSEFEYELYLSIKEDSVTKKNYLNFAFRTTKIFESFLYRMNVQLMENLEDNEIQFNVEGLSAPKIGLGKYGPAEYDYKLYDFDKKPYSVKLLRNGKSKILYQIKMDKQNIILVKKPQNSFIKLFIE